MSEQVRPGVEVTERGNIYFFYRPAVGAETPQGLVDVQRFHFVLSPEGSDVLRLLTIGKKRLPDPGDSGQRFWGFVKKVSEDPEELARELEGGNDEGRARTPARPAGEGCMPSPRTATTPTSCTPWSCPRSRTRSSASCTS